MASMTIFPVSISLRFKKYFLGIQTANYLRKTTEEAMQLADSFPGYRVHVFREVPRAAFHKMQRNRLDAND